MALHRKHRRMQDEAQEALNVISGHLFRNEGPVSTEKLESAFDTLKDLQIAHYAACLALESIKSRVNDLDLEL